MKTITLTQGRCALVDDDVFEHVGHLRWSVNHGYPARTVVRGGRPVTEYLHRVVLNEPEGLQVDHINEDKLDNRRCNLRAVTQSQNIHNQSRPRSDSGTGIRNVFMLSGAQARPKPYYVRFQFRGSGLSVRRGMFATLAEAQVVADALRAEMLAALPQSEAS